MIRVKLKFGFMSGNQDLVNGYWKGLSKVALGVVAEMLAQTLFLKKQFHVYPNLSDDNGIDLIVTNARFESFFIQVKSIRSGTDYVYMREKFFNDKVPRLYCLLISFKDEEPEIFLIPFNEWKMNNPIFPHRSKYKQPEFGINASKRNLKNMEYLHFEKIINKLI
jgi:hypothetical protein